MSSETRKVAYRPDIDGLRALAVLLVLFFHAFPKYMPGGFVGVDVFFVISGYLITSLLIDRAKKGTLSITNFYSRRVLRIFPALLLVFASVGFLAWLFLLPGELKQLGLHLASASGFFSNFVFWKEAGYFDTDAISKPLLHLWSLSIEEQFYLLWPLLLIFTLKRRFFPYLLALLAFASFRYNIHLLETDRVGAYYSPFGRAWELLLGSLAACLQTSERSTRVRIYLSKFFKLTPIPEIASLLGLTSIVFVAVHIDGTYAFPGYWALLPVLGCLSVMTMGEGSFLNKKLLSQPVLVGVGLISYPLYLWHWMALSFTHIIVPSPGWHLVVASVLVSFLLSYLTYTLVEKPLRKTNNPTLSVSLLSSAMLLLGTSAFFISRSDGITSRNQEITQVLKKASEHQSLWGFPDYGKGRSVKFQHSTFYEIPGQKNSQVVFFGDSNIQMFWVRMGEILNAKHMSPLSSALFVSRYCPPIPHVTQLGSDACDGFAEDLLDYIHRNRKDIDRLVVASYWFNFLLQIGNKSTFVFTDKQGKQHPLVGSNSPGVQMALSSLESMLVEIKNKGIPVTLVLNIPRNPKGSSAGHYLRTLSGIRFDPVWSKHDMEETYGPVQEALREIGRRAQVEVLDPWDSLCEHQSCSAIMNELFVYYNETHLSPYYISKHVGFLDKVLF